MRFKPDTNQCMTRKGIKKSMVYPYTHRLTSSKFFNSINYPWKEVGKWQRKEFNGLIVVADSYSCTWASNGGCKVQTYNKIKLIGLN